MDFKCIQLIKDGLKRAEEDLKATGEALKLAEELLKDTKKLQEAEKKAERYRLRKRVHTNDGDELRAEITRSEAEAAKRYEQLAVITEKRIKLQNAIEHFGSQ